MRLNSGRELYLGRSFYHMGPKPIERGGSPSQDIEQHDSSKPSKQLSLIGLLNAKGELRYHVSFHLGVLEDANKL